MSQFLKIKLFWKKEAKLGLSENIFLAQIEHKIQSE